MATFSNMFSVFFLILFVGIATSNPDELTKSINKFSTDLFEEVAWHSEVNVGKNIFTSAMSAHIVLTLLSFGANGTTQDEMNKALYETDPNIKYAYKGVVTKMNTYMHYTETVYVQNGEELNPDFSGKATGIFNGSVEKIDFSNGADAAKKINLWVQGNTENTIQNFANASDFNNTTSVVLVNTLCSKGEWNKKFDPTKTSKEDFYTYSGSTIKVDMMKQELKTNYSENSDLGAKILQLAFKGNMASMVFILPNQKDGLKDLEKMLKKQDMQALVNSLQSEDVNVNLPKIHIESYANLNDDLGNLGMKTMFTDKADFGGILANSSIQLKTYKVFQKAFLDLNEDGITASGATGEITMKKNSSKRNVSKDFKANYPYFFAMFNADNQIVFSGHFTGQN